MEFKEGMDYNRPEEGYFPPELTDLSWRDLQRLVKFHTRLAETYQQRAQRLRGIELMERDIASRVEELSTSYRVVLRFLDQGYNNLESAQAAAARELKIPETAVQGWWKIFIRNRDRKIREERDRAIIACVQAGLKNDEIALRFDICANTVSRTITGYLHGSLRPCDRARLRKRRKLQ